LIREAISRGCNVLRAQHKGLNATGVKYVTTPAPFFPAYITGRDPKSITAKDFANLPEWDVSNSTSVDRIHVNDVSVETFRRKFEEPYFPVIIQGLADHWKANERWTLDAIGRGEYRSVPMKAGEDDDGYSVRIKLKYYMQYLHTNRDDSPLYVFDSSFDDNDLSRGLMRDYDLPVYFRDDLFKLVGTKRRPPHRWWLVGPERSGSSLHIDPLATSAWNTLMCGRKYWVCMPPSIAKRYAKGTGLRKKGEDGEAITWFTKILPRIKAAERKRTGGEPLNLMEFIQYPGETIFVPGGWWHAVLNLDHTVAVTQNFVSRVNFPKVWIKTRKGRKHMARRWLIELRSYFEELHTLAVQINKEDNFVFNFNTAIKGE
jgi:histone arginine demethylase JMJD6